MSHLLCSQDTRTHVVGELYDTERSYVESLQILVEKYMKPLKSLESNRVLIDSVLVDEIFYSIPEILQHHESFLGALQDRLSSDWDSSQVIGNVFIEAFTNQQIIDDYTAFINNWKNARQAIKVATQAKPAFERFLEAMSREHRNKLTLDALLIMPVQRIPRYELLIKELIKHTSEDHPDHKPLMEAQKKIHELALKIDRAEKEMIHQEQLRDLEALIEGHVELQHHQRDFIRYDLVTIVSASALTATKKERVLFLFCDLLIMTSIKKKASRRSNLQNAFANSTNDLSLLEGNKFKLLLRVSLDQIEIRLDYDQMQLHQQHQQQQQQDHEHHQLQLQRQQQNKLIQERRRKIELDLQNLQQIQSLAANLTTSHVQRVKLDDVITELLTDTKQKLGGIELNAATSAPDMQNLADEKLSQYSAHDLYLTPSPVASITSSASANQQTPSHHHHHLHQTSLQSNQPAQSTSPTPSSANHHHHHQDSSTSLEFLINNNSGCNNGLTGKESTNDFLTIDHSGGYSIGNSIGQTLSTVADNMQLLNAASNNNNTSSHQSSNSDSLVVTFSSIERRQAFIQAFIEAKQQRYQQKQLQQQQQQYQQDKIFSSSVTLKLAQPGSAPGVAISSHEKRSSALADPRLHHQESADAYLARVGQQRPSSVSAAGHTPSRLSSSSPLQQLLPIHQPSDSVIVHQMSAPQYLDSGASAAAMGCKERSHSSQCTSCSYNLVAEAEKAQLREHHHHHQLMHQPASQPASLDTICCHDPHNNWDPDEPSSPSRQLKQLDGISDNVCSVNQKQQQKLARRQCLVDYNQQNMSRHLNSVVNLNNVGDQATSSKSTIFGGSISEEQQLIDQMNFNLLLTKCAPKFLVTLPVDFLSTQHPALQFTCSAPSRNHSSLAAITGLKIGQFLKNPAQSNFDCLKSMPQRTMISQTFEDNHGQLWLCMSNGYVSHVALVTIKRRELERLCGGASGDEQSSCGHASQTQQQMNCYSITPVVISAGDICKSHINCAAQVKWAKSPVLEHHRQHPGATIKTTAAGSRDIHNEKRIAERLSNESVESRPTTEVDNALEVETVEEMRKEQEDGMADLSSPSPPIDIKCKNQTLISAVATTTTIAATMESQESKQDPRVHLSESAPSPSPIQKSSSHQDLKSRNASSASTTRLEVPSHRIMCDQSCDSKSILHHHQPICSAAFNTRNIEHKRSNHDEICHRHYHDNLTAAKHLSYDINSAAPMSSSSVQQIPRGSKHHPHHQHHHHHHHHHHLQHIFNHHPHSHQHQSNQHSPSNRSQNHTHSHQHHHHSHNNQHQHHHHHHSNSPHPYGSRHNTVPIAELRRGLDRQSTIEHPRHGQFLSPQTSSQVMDAGSNRSNSPTLGQKCAKMNSLDSAASERQRSVSPKTSSTRPTTPTSLASASMAKGFRSARLMRHQASLKTSSILARLVGGATRRSIQMRRSNEARDKSSDLTDDNDTDTDTGGGLQHRINSDESPTTAAAEQNIGQRVASQQLEPTAVLINNKNNNNSAVVSPLSSVSSLNSTTSSFTVNSVCASSPNRSSYELLAHSYSTTCCVGGGGSGVSPPPTLLTDSHALSAAFRGEVCGHRGRSATAPSRPLCGGPMVAGSLTMLSPPNETPNGTRLTHHRSFAIVNPSTVSVHTTAMAKMNSMTTTTTTTSRAAGRGYKVSEIVNDDAIAAAAEAAKVIDGDCLNQQQYHQQLTSGGDSTTIKRSSSCGGGEGSSRDLPTATSSFAGMNSSLWLGCDDGSLIIIDCLVAENGDGTGNNYSDNPQRLARPNKSNDNNDNSLDLGDQQQKTFTCGNVHSEIKLGSAISDISTYKDEKVFVALSNGQLAVFSRVVCGEFERSDEENVALQSIDDDNDNDQDRVWSLTNPEIITVTVNELNATARLCQIETDNKSGDSQFLWYSYGRNIFVFNIETLKLETTIMAPTNDVSLRLTVQAAITIDNMELMQNLSGVWVSFKNSHLLQFYDINSYKLLVEINLFEPINKLLSYGNEIIRQHKTACLKATSLLNYHNEKEQCNTLFIGTSAGIILYLTISADHLPTTREEPILDWKPQIASLRHGHSGHVKLLRLIEMDNDQRPDVEAAAGAKNGNNNGRDGSLDICNSLYLISGGTGLDIYGPSGEQQNFISQLNSDEDSLNHLMIWQL